MKHLTQTLLSTASLNARKFFLPLLASAGLIATVCASDYHFNLVGQPSVQRAGDDSGETVALTGAGSFDPDTGTASGGGSFHLHNSFDEMKRFGTPDPSGTWQVTGFGGYDAGDGTLTLHVLFTFDRVSIKAAKDFTVPVVITVSADGITVRFPNGEYFAVNQTGSGFIHAN